MSLMDGISGLGTGLSAFGKEGLADTLAPRRTPLLMMPTPAVVPTETPVVAQPDDSAGHKPGASVDAATMARAQQVYAGLVKRGMDPSSALGFAANAVQESAANPKTGAGDMGASHGLLQWRGDRLDRYVQMFGHPPEHGDLDEQLSYVMHELSGPEANAWKAIQAAPDDPVARAAAISQHFERPKDTAAEMARRGWIAGQLAKSFGGVG